MLKLTPEAQEAIGTAFANPNVMKYLKDILEIAVNDLAEATPAGYTHQELVEHHVKVAHTKGSAALVEQFIKMGEAVIAARKT